MMWGDFTMDPRIEQGVRTGSWAGLGKVRWDISNDWTSVRGRKHDLTRMFGKYSVQDRPNIRSRRRTPMEAIGLFANNQQLVREDGCPTIHDLADKVRIRHASCHRQISAACWSFLKDLPQSASQSEEHAHRFISHEGIVFKIFVPAGQRVNSTFSCDADVTAASKCAKTSPELCWQRNRHSVTTMSEKVMKSLDLPQ